MVSAYEEKAESCYKIGVEYGIEKASLYLGEMYLRGMHGGKPNPRKARRALEDASDMGNREAAALLGKAYDEGLLGKVNPKQAFRYYLLAAERGDTSSMRKEMPMAIRRSASSSPSPPPNTSQGLPGR